MRRPRRLAFGGLALVLAALVDCAKPSSTAPDAATIPPGAVIGPGGVDTSPAALVAPVTAAEAPDPRAAEAPGEDLQQETREADPRSQTVTLKLWVVPAQGAEVFWGAKRLGKVDKPPFEIERPRRSGPMDLIVRAPGYLPYHTRLFTDRDDRLTIRLVRPQDSGGMLGARRMGATPGGASVDAGLPGL